MNTEKHDVVLVRLLQRRQRGGEKGIQQMVATIADKSMTKHFTNKGWKWDFVDYTETDLSEQEGRKVYRYEMNWTLTFAHQVNQPSTIEYLTLIRTLNSVAANNGGWAVEMLDAEEYEELDEGDAPLAKHFVGYTDVELPDDFERWFDHLYGVEDQVEMLKSKLEASIEDDWQSRFHCVFVGPPGCGKSDAAHTLKRMLGEEAVLEVDCTSLTGPGAIELLKDLEILPRIMIFEEVEKAKSNEVTNFMLAVMDQRGEIRKNTARQSIQRDTKLFCIGTVNNYDKFEAMNEGALASRFGEPVFFNRPTREMMEMILEREVNRVEGNLAWIAPALDYIEEHGIESTRRVIDLCMCGRDRWLAPPKNPDSGAPNRYVEMLNNTSRERNPVATEVQFVDGNAEMARQFEAFLASRNSDDS
jgi:DNA polymerase III delta prime subunit